MYVYKSIKVRYLLSYEVFRNRILRGGACTMRYDAWIRYSLGKEVLLAFTLTLAVVFDYLTGSAAALRTGAWSSRAACDGLWRKAGIMAGVLLAALMDFALRALTIGVPVLNIAYDALLCPLVMMWYLLAELGSIIKNIGALGAPIPEFLTRVIARVIAVLRAIFWGHK